jgi:hypothetical protein
VRIILSSFSWREHPEDDLVMTSAAQTNKRKFGRISGIAGMSTELVTMYNVRSGRAFQLRWPARLKAEG